MRDRPALRQFARRAGAIDMDPIIVAGEPGEGVDLLLVDGDPFARAELLADISLQVRRPLDFDHARLLRSQLIQITALHVDIAPRAPGEIGEDRADRLRVT